MKENDFSKKNTSNRGLGKGFHSLLGVDDDVELNGGLEWKQSVQEIDLSYISPNPDQPRKLFDEQSILSLAESIKKEGLIQPIVVVAKENQGDKAQEYHILAGERRWRAAQKAGLTKIPCLVKKVEQKDFLRIALVENIQRENLNPIDEALAYETLMDTFGLNHEECAELVAKDRTSVSNFVRLLSLPKQIQEDIAGGVLTVGHGKAILSLEEPKLMLRTRDVVVKKALSVRQTEQLCKRTKKAKNEIEGGEVAEPSFDADLDYVADLIRNHFQSKIKLTGSTKKGRIEISYFSAEELERVLNIIGISLEGQA